MVKHNAKEPWKLLREYDVTLYALLEKEAFEQLERLAASDFYRESEEKKDLLKRIGLLRVSEHTSFSTDRVGRIHGAVLRCRKDARAYLDAHREKYEQDAAEGNGKLLFAKQRELPAKKRAVGFFKGDRPPRSVALLARYAQPNEESESIREEDIPF